MLKSLQATTYAAPPKLHFCLCPCLCASIYTYARSVLSTVYCAYFVFGDDACKIQRNKENRANMKRLPYSEVASMMAAIKIE